MRGRPKGALNKTTVAVKDALAEAFAGIGGTQQLQAWAQENPTEFYKIWAKLLPIQIAGDADNPLQVVSKIEVELVSPKTASR